MAASRNPRARLLHIRDEIEGVAIALQGVDLDQFRKSYTLRRTTERALQIISEAAKSLPAHYHARYPEASWKAIVALGNILRHEYQRVDDGLLWEIATVHLPKLLPIGEQLLSDEK
jgi:uncharacterized protein with HEPN domain